jgi:hypothetical protein
VCLFAPRAVTRFPKHHDCHTGVAWISGNYGEWWTKSWPKSFVMRGGAPEQGPPKDDSKQQCLHQLPPGPKFQADI